MLHTHAHTHTRTGDNAGGRGAGADGEAGEQGERDGQAAGGQGRAATAVDAAHRALAQGRRSLAGYRQVGRRRRRRRHGDVCLVSVGVCIPHRHACVSLWDRAAAAGMERLLRCVAAASLRWRCRSHRPGSWKSLLPCLTECSSSSSLRPLSLPPLPLFRESVSTFNARVIFCGFTLPYLLMVSASCASYFSDIVSNSWSCTFCCCAGGDCLLTWSSTALKRASSATSAWRASACALASSMRSAVFCAFSICTWSHRVSRGASAVCSHCAYCHTFA